MGARAFPPPAGPRGQPVWDLSTGNPDPRLLPPLAPALAAVRPARTDVDNVNSVLPELREIALARFDCDHVPAGDVGVFNGALDAMERVLAARVAAGDRVAVEDPGYPPVYYLVAALGLKAAPVPVDDRGLVPGELARVLREGARAVVATPRAQNPTGAFLAPERAEELRAVLRGHPDVLVVEDDHASDIAGPAATVLAEPGRARWAVIRSASKALGADLRLAVLAADQGTYTMVRGRQRRGPGWVSGLIQQVVAHQWSDPDSLSALRAARAAYAGRRGAIVAALAARGIGAHGSSGLNVWVPVRDEDLIAAHLLRRGYRVAPGSKYRRASPPAVRVTAAAFPPGEAGAFAEAFAEAIDAAASGRRPKREER